METAPNQRPTSTAPHLSPQRSPVTNRTTLHEAIYEVDGNKAVAKRFRDLVDSLLAELGEPDPDERQFTAIRTAAMATVRMEALEADHCAGRPVSDPIYTRLVGTLRQARIDLGLDGNGKDEPEQEPVPDVADTLAKAGKALPPSAA